MGVTIEVTGGEALASRLLELDQAMNQPLRPLFDQVSAEWVTEFQSHFRNQGDAAGKWASLSPATQRLRAKAGIGAASPILERTGDLLQSITPTFAEDQMSVGTAKTFAALLQFGGSTGSKSRIPNRTVPARPFISLSQEAIDDAFENITAYFLPEPGTGGDALA